MVEFKPRLGIWPAMTFDCSMLSLGLKVRKVRNETLLKRQSTAADLGEKQTPKIAVAR